MRSLYFTNRKEFYRRKKISLAVKNYWGKVKSGEIIRGKRIRRQVAYNAGYDVSIRGISINGASEEQLKNAVDEYLFSNPQLLRMSWGYEGYESEEIDVTEDKNLKSGKIYIEINIRGEVTLTEV